MERAVALARGSRVELDANQLRIGSATLYRKLKSYGLIGGKQALRKGAPTRS